MRSFLPVKPHKKFVARKVSRPTTQIKKDQTALNKAARERKVYIDAVLMKEGRITIAEMLAEHDITYYTAASDLRKYAQANPRNVSTFSENNRTVWLAAKPFTPLFPDEVKYVKPT